MKRILCMALAMLMVLCMAACSSGPEGANSGSASGKTNYIIGTGGVGGTYYPLGGALAKVWTDNVDGLTVTAQSTGASVENTSLLESGAGPDTE